MRFTSDAVRSAMLLYAITDRSWLKPGESLTDVTARVLDAGATFLQIREKDLAPDRFEAEAEALRALCEKRRVPFVVNDNVEIALQCGADGVHVGQSDIVGRDVRKLIGPDKLLGISAGTVSEAQAAEAAGADYVGVGAVFGTSTKKDARCMTVERLREIAESVSIPVVAIGGINAENIPLLAGSGIDGVAVISAIFGAPDPAAATEELLSRVREIVQA